ncbi:hypothetical protein [Seonamhaeicola sp.]|uniref:aldose epimerase family protein n=1 Tax=Seonamhaeicola sp. TaxID=1912245 RepID=UPI0026141C16|nr:hypothetical protein [Seonamhaeicola sp.]
MILKSFRNVTLCSIIAVFSISVRAQQITSIENEFIKVEISSRGGEIQSVTSKKTGKQYIHNDKKIWKNKAPLMFPVAVRYKDNAYTYKGQHYTMPTMGLLMRSQIEVKKTSPSSASCTFQSSAKTKKNYPFDFSLTIVYKLEENELIHEFIIENLSNDFMYYDLGGHPIFALSLGDNKTREDYQFTFSKPVTIKRHPIVKALKQTSALSFLKNDTALDIDDQRMPKQGGILLLDFPKTTVVGIAEKGKKPFIEINIGNFNNLNLWAPNDKPILAIEPMIGHHDGQESPLAIEEKPQVATLKPKEIKSCHFSLFIY